MKKKLLSMILASAMALSVCACGDETTNADGSSESQVAQSTTESKETVASDEPEQPQEYVPTYPIVENPITIKGLVVGADTSFMNDRIVWQKVAEVSGITIEWENIDKEALAT